MFTIERANELLGDLVLKGVNERQVLGLLLNGIKDLLLNVERLQDRVAKLEARPARRKKGA